jgi:chemotaxis protein MotB
MENSVDPQRVSIQGFSEYRPLLENTTSQNRQKNRRVEIALIKEQGKTPER